MKKGILIRVFLICLSLVMLLSFVACNQGEQETQSKEETSEKQTESTSDSLSQTETESETEEETNLILGENVAYASSFKVSGVFGDNMVIQRNEYIRIWGWAEESENGKKVSASFMGMTADALIENGEWEIIIHSKLPANTTGQELKVYTDSSETVFKNVLVGDVFMVIGQSNVQSNISEHLSYESDKDRWSLEDLNKDALIRMNYNSNTDSEGYPTRGTTDVCPDVVTNNGWVIPDEENILRLSALGYFTALQIVELTENQIPIGIAQFSASGRTLSVFMPNELADEMKTDRFDEANGIYIGNYHAHVVTRYMYNHYIYPYERMPIAGIVWCQGESESNIALSSVYVERFKALMSYMRSTHNLVNPEFPVFLVEFPTVYKDPGTSSQEWQYLDTGRIRAVEGTIPMNLSNSYMISSSDLWADKTHWNNIHPYVKFEQSERIAALMDAVIYGGKTLDEAAAPVLSSYKISSDSKKITLKFANCGDGLKTIDGEALKGVVAIGKKNAIETRVTLTVEITGSDTVTVTSNKTICGVAYHCESDSFFGEDINLCDSNGTPALAFWIYEE